MRVNPLRRDRFLETGANRLETIPKLLCMKAENFKNNCNHKLTQGVESIREL
jgi:hypothetical protein